MRYGIDTFADNFRRIREERGYTIKQLSEITELSEGTLVKTESIRSNPRLLTILILCEALDCEISDLIN